MKAIIRVSLMLILYSVSALSIISCSSENGDSQSVFTCSSIAGDSLANPDNTVAHLIDSATIGNPTYYVFIGPRQSLTSGSPLLDYMVHEPIGTSKDILLVLIAGGQLDAAITGAGDSAPVTTAGINFLVRSAHLFAKQGYRVLTIDRPSDYADFLDPPASTSGSALDVKYRTRIQHAVDLSAMINRVNAINQPVIILGTSRGGISAVAQHKLGAAIAISNPVSSGINGDPVSVTDANQVPSPAHVLWHINDGCISTQPANSEALASAFPDGSANAVKGGFEPVGTNLCGAISHHGFLGIESCAVGKTTGWIDNKRVALPTSRPIANTATVSTSMNTPKSDIDLTGYAVGSTLTFSLPHSETSLGGSVSINLTNNFVTYTPPPADISGITDTFVYVVTEAGGGTNHNVISVTITP